MNWEPWRQEFLNKKVLLTGGSGQIGAVIGERYSLAGAFVANLDVESPAGNPKLLEESSYSGQPGVYSLHVDITRRQAVEQAVDQMVRIAGGIDIVINCAGIGVFTPFEQRTDEEFDAVVDLNLKGTFLVTQAVSRAMIDQGTKGVILNVGSIYGISAADKRMYGNSGRNSSEVYAMTKAGIIHFTKYMAKYLASYNIRVNCVSPGGVFAGQDPQFLKHYVDKTPLGRLADPEDLIGGIFFLTSSWSQYVTGQNLVIDGGFTIGD